MPNLVYYRRLCFILLIGLSTSISADIRFYPNERQGTGWAVSSRYIITNNHILGDLVDVMLVAPGQPNTFGSVVAIDKTNDIALIQIEHTALDLKPLKLTQESARMGEDVFTIGYPHARIMGSTPKMTKGIINAVAGIADDPRMYQISVPLQPGNSGGPLFNMQGDVIGITTAKLSSTEIIQHTGVVPENVNYAIKSHNIHSLIEEIPVNYSVNRPKDNNQVLPDIAEKLQDSIFIIYPGVFGKKTRLNKISLGSATAIPPKKFHQYVELTHWDGTWVGEKGSGFQGDCSATQPQILNATIKSGQIKLIEIYIDTVGKLFRPNMLKGSIDNIGNVLIDKASDLNNTHFIYKGYFEGKHMVGIWQNESCKGHWFLEKK